VSTVRIPEGGVSAGSFGENMSRKTKEAAKIRATQAIAHRKRNRIVAGVVALAALGGLAWAYGEVVNTPPVAVRSATWDVRQVGSNDVAYGDPKAPARVTEYGSLTCVHCKDFHDKAFASFKKDYVDTGKVYFVYSHFPYDAASLQAATAVSCLPKDRRAAAISKLYDTQSDWAGEEDVAGSVVTALGLDAATNGQVVNCLVDGRTREAVTKTAFESGSVKGVASTPTFVVNGGVYEGFMSSDVLGAIALSTVSN
jgi:protein-disulfide isomerase